MLCIDSGARELQIGTVDSICFETSTVVTPPSALFANYQV